MNSSKREQIFSRFRNANPHPTTELVFENNFQLLISVVLSAQSTDVAVNLATKGLFEKAPDPESMIELGLTEIKDAIKTIGLYNNKAKNVLGICEILVSQYNSQVPDTLEQLTALPGVGRKTANVVLNTAFGQPTIAVDTHIFRVSNRTGIAKGKNVDLVERGLMKFVPNEYLLDAHHWLILHGRYTCMAKKPLCGSCIIFDLCEWPGRTKTAATQ